MNWTLRAEMNPLRNLIVRLEGQVTLIDNASKFGLDGCMRIYDILFFAAVEHNRTGPITDDRVMFNRIAGTEIRTITLDAWTPLP